MEKFKLLIIGGGPAGMTASIYASRYKIPHLIISPILGGSASEAHLIENWPGIKQIKGSALMDNFWEHAKSYSPSFWQEEAKKIQKENNEFKVLTSGGREVAGNALIFSCGTQYKRLTVPGEKELLGRGVSYCATCDGAFFKDKKVAVIGGANSAVMASIELAQHASKVYLIFRGEELKGEPVWVDRVKENSKIVLIAGTNITKIVGTNKVEKIILDKDFEGSREIELEGVFIEIGVTPLGEMAKNLGIKLDNLGAIEINSRGETNVPGFFAAGDTTTGSGGFRQVITAAAEGAIAARSSFEYLKEKKLI